MVGRFCDHDRQLTESKPDRRDHFGMSKSGRPLLGLR